MTADVISVMLVITELLLPAAGGSECTCTCDGGVAGGGGVSFFGSAGGHCNGERMMLWLG